MTTEFKNNSSDAVRQLPATFDLSSIEGGDKKFPGSLKTYAEVAASVFLTKHQAFLDNQKKLEAENKQTMKLVKEAPTEHKAYAFTA